MSEQVFQLSATQRVVARVDEWPASIASVIKNYGLACATLNRPTLYSGDVSVEGDYSRDVQSIIDEGLKGWSPDSVEAGVSDTLTDAGVPFVIANLTGYGQGEWHDLVIWSPDKSWTVYDLDKVATEVDAVFSGDVYFVTVETAKVFTASDGETVTRWYSDDEFEPLVAIEKLFTLDADWILSNLGLEVQA